MSNSQRPEPTEADYRAKVFRVGCIVNVATFAVLAVLSTIFLVALFRKPPSADEAAIRAVLDSQVKSWNESDIEGFMGGYWNDERLAFTSGDTIQQGWNATRDRYYARYKTQGKSMGKLSFTELQFENLAADAALVRGRYTLHYNDHDETGRFTLAFRKFADGWKITSDHTSVECIK